MPRGNKLIKRHSKINLHLEEIKAKTKTNKNVIKLKIEHTQLKSKAIQNYRYSVTARHLQM